MAARRLRAPEIAANIDADDVVTRAPDAPQAVTGDRPSKRQRKAPLFTTGVLLKGITQLAKKCPIKVRGADEAEKIQSITGELNQWCKDFWPHKKFADMASRMESLSSSNLVQNELGKLKRGEQPTDWTELVQQQQEAAEERKKRMEERKKFMNDPSATLYEEERSRDEDDVADGNEPALQPEQDEADD